jgi:hypothetical protein
MSETIFSPPQALPEFSGSLEMWERDVSILTTAFQNPEGYIYDAQLPETIGYMPQAEIESIEAWNGIETGDEPTYFSADENTATPISLIDTVMPITIEMIRTDIDLVTDNRAYLRHFEVEKKRTAAGNAPRNGDIHTDSAVKYSEDVYKPTYIICNNNPTLFYTGSAKLEMGFRLRLVSDSLDGTAVHNMVAAPPYSIVRLSYATVHASPVFTERGLRIFMRGSTSLK